jgi:hypothetical protein
MPYSQFCNYRFEIAFIFAAAVRSKVFDLEVGFRLDLLDEFSKFAFDRSGGLVVDCSDPAPVCGLIEEGEK